MAYNSIWDSGIIEKRFMHGEYDGKPLRHAVTKWNKELLISCREAREKIEHLMYMMACLNMMAQYLGLSTDSPELREQFNGIRGNLFQMFDSCKSQAGFLHMMDKALLTYAVENRNLYKTLSNEFNFAVGSRCKNFENNIIPEYLSYLGFEGYCSYIHSHEMLIVDEFMRVRNKELSNYTRDEIEELKDNKEYGQMLSNAYMVYLSDFCKEHNIQISSASSALQSRLEAKKRRVEIIQREKDKEFLENKKYYIDNYVCPLMSEISFLRRNINNRTLQPFTYVTQNPLVDMTVYGSFTLVIPVAYRYYAKNKVSSNYVRADYWSDAKTKFTKSIRQAMCAKLGVDDLGMLDKVKEEIEKDKSYTVMLIQVQY